MQAPGIQAGTLRQEDAMLHHSRRLHVSKVPKDGKAPPPAPPPAGICGAGGQPKCTGAALAGAFHCFCVPGTEFHAWFVA